MEAPHRKVHEYGMQAFQALQQGNYTESVRLLKMMEKASDELMQLLGQLQHALS